MNGTRSKAVVAAALLLLGAGAERAAAQQTVEGPRLRANVLEIKLGGRVQTQFNTTTADDVPTSEVLLRRVRLEAEVKVNELVSGKIAPDFAGNRVSLKDAYLKLNFSPGVQLLAGNAYKPFGLLEQTSSNRILPIERGARIRGVDAFDEYALVNGLDYSDRDLGFQVMGEPEGAPLGFAYAAGVFRGPLQGRVGAEDSYQFAARATVRPLEDLQLGLGWSSRDFAIPQVPAGPFDIERGNAFEVDVEYGAFDPGFHLLGEVAVGDGDPFAGGDFLGAQAWLGYRTGAVGLLTAVEPVLRLSYGELDELADTLGSGGTLLTPGLNLYFGGLNRFQINYDAWLPNAEGADSEGALRAQFQLAF